ncbi:MAG: TetR/AcrR family transcriptional regulator [Planctomycetota bacterium]
MNWQRARNAGQKAERIEAIQAAAADLFDEKELSEISMRDVAERAGLGKASLYHYFKTKEEVFISLYESELAEWLHDVEQRIRRLRSPTPQRVAKSLTDALRERERFIRLAVVFATILEHNLSVEFIREFKRSLLMPLGQCSELLAAALPNLSEKRIQEFLFQHHAIVAGLWPLANPSQDVRSVLLEEEFRNLKIDFFSVFESSMQRLLSDP